VGSKDTIRPAKRSESLRDFDQQPAGRNLLSEIHGMKKAAKGLRLWYDLKQINLGDLSRFPRPKPRVRCLKEASETKRDRAGETARLVHEYKRTHSCKHCGVRPQVPWELRFFEAHLPADQKIRCLMPKLGPEHLTVELEKRDLYCPTCYDSVLTEYHKRAQSLRPAERLRSTLAKHPDEAAVDPHRG
jgi:hypothetical protein